MRRVVVTGLGVISPVGNDTATFFENLLSARSGVTRLPESHVLWNTVSTRIAALVEFDGRAHFNKSQLLTLERCSQFAVAATRQALADSGLRSADFDSERIGVYWGTGMGGATTIEDVAKALFRDEASRLSPFTLIRVMPNAAASHIALEHGFRGPCLTFANACASSAVAIGEAFRAIQSGYVDGVIAGGAEALLTQMSVKSWEALKTLAVEDEDDCSTSCKPFSKNRSGLVLGEGAGCVMLEDLESARRRGAKIYAELLAYGCTCDATHLTKPSPEGQGRAMNIAMKLGNIQPSEVDYINAHGTATQAGDEAETSAIKSVFGEHAYKLAVSSTKSMHGHLLGATGAVEFISTVLTVRQNEVPPTAHLKDPDPSLDLNYVPNVARHDKQVTIALSNSFAFGGTNAVLVLKKYETDVCQ